MREKLTKRGRKRLLSSVPSNYSFWRCVLKNKNEVDKFINKGDERQHSCMIRTVNYLRKFDNEFYNEINGKEILKRLKVNESI